MKKNWYRIAVSLLAAGMVLAAAGCGGKTGGQNAGAPSGDTGGKKTSGVQAASPGEFGYVWETRGQSVRITYYTGDGTAIVFPDTIESYPVVSIENIFTGNEQIQSVSFPDTVTTIGSFAGCTSLASVKFPAALVSLGDEAFRGCTSLTAVDLSSASGLEAVSEAAFRGCTALAAVSLPEGLKTIGASAFYGCGALAKVTLPESCTGIEPTAFYNCMALAGVKLSASLFSVGRLAFGNCWNLYDLNVPLTLTEFPVPRYYNDNSAFYGCEKLPFAVRDALIAGGYKDRI